MCSSLSQAYSVWARERKFSRHWILDEKAYKCSPFCNWAKHLYTKPKRNMKMFVHSERVWRHLSIFVGRYTLALIVFIRAPGGNISTLSLSHGVRFFAHDCVVWTGMVLCLGHAQVDFMLVWHATIYRYADERKPITDLSK